MRSLEDAETRLKNELIHWFHQQSNRPFDDFYLYYLPSSNEHDGGLLICSKPPHNQSYKLAMAEKIEKFSTVDQNFNRIRLSILCKLPILSLK